MNIHVGLSKENAMPKQQAEEKIAPTSTNLSDIGVQFPHPVRLSIRTPVPVPAREPVVSHSVQVKTEPISPHKEMWICKAEICEDNLVLMSGINSTRLESVKQERDVEHWPTVKKELLEMDTDVLLADYNKHFNYPVYPWELLTSVKGRQPCGEPENLVPETVGLRYESGTARDTSLCAHEYQTAKYQPVVRLERLPNMGPILLGDCAPPVHVPSWGKHGRKSNRKTGFKQIRQQPRSQISRQQRSKAPIKPIRVMGKLDDLPLQIPSALGNTHLTGANGRPLQTTDQDPAPPITCGDASVSDTLTDSNTRGAQEIPRPSNQEKLKKLTMGVRWISRKYFVGRCKKNEKQEFTCLKCPKRYSNKVALKFHLLTHSEGTHVCDVCGKRFTRRYSLTLHMRTHTGERSFTCKICDRGFVSLACLNSHSKIHGSTNTKPHTCKVCRKQFMTACSLKSHSVIHAGERPFMCDVCHKGYLSSSHLKVHMLSHTGENPFPCTFCEKGFKSSSHLRRHVATHTGEKPYTCNVCQKRFCDSGNLKQHIMSVHMGEKPFTCEICNKKFANSSGLKTHNRIHTGDVKTYTCNICNKRLSSAFYLKQHHLLHTGEKPHSCEFCQKKFTLKGHLKLHMLSHTGERPHICTLCQKTFRCSSHLKRHEAIHSGEKPFSCALCQKCFKTSGGLRSHMKKHTGEKPYTCDICHKSFRTNSYLKKHHMIHRGEKPHTCDICNKSFTLISNLKRHILTHK